MRQEEYQQKERSWVQALSSAQSSVSSSHVAHTEAVQLRAELDRISKSFESAQESMKETDRSLRKQLAELKLQNEQLNIQLDYERNQEGGYEDAEHDEEEEASSEVSFQQTWPLTATTSQKRDEKAPPKRRSFEPRLGGTRCCTHWCRHYGSVGPRR